MSLCCGWPRCCPVLVYEGAGASSSLPTRAPACSWKLNLMFWQGGSVGWFLSSSTSGKWLLPPLHDHLTWISWSDQTYYGDSLGLRIMWWATCLLVFQHHMRWNLHSWYGLLFPQDLHFCCYPLQTSLCLLLRLSVLLNPALVASCGHSCNPQLAYMSSPGEEKVVPEISYSSKL